MQHLCEIANMALCLDESIVGVHTGLDAMLAHLLKLQHPHKSSQSLSIRPKERLYIDAAKELGT